MSNLKYPIFKLPEYYIREFEKRELPRYMKWWLYQSYLRKHSQKLSDIITGSNFTLENTVARKFNIFEVGGNTEQTQLTGKNLFDNTIPISGVTYNRENDLFTFHRDSGMDFLITINKLNLKTNTNYMLYMNISENTMSAQMSLVSSTTSFLEGSFVITAGETGVKSAQLTTKSSTEGLLYDLWFYCTNATGNLKAQIMLVEGTTAGNYELYCGGIPSPNPEYPQDIKNVTGDVNVKIENKNLWNYKKASNIENTEISNYRIFEISGLKPNELYNINNMGFNAVLENQYCYLWSGKTYTTSTDKYLLAYPSMYYTKANFRPNNEGKIYLAIYPTDENTWQNVIAYLENAQIELGTTPTDYVEHEEQNLPFTLASGQKIMQDGGLKDDGIHNVRGQIVLDGTEDWTDFSYTSGEDNFRVQLSNRVPNILTPPTNPANLKCNYFTAVNRDSAYRKEVVGIAQYGLNLGTLFICAPISILSTQDMAGWKTWLSTHNLLVEYELAEEEITSYNETQQEQYNAIQNAKTYNEQTNITTSSDELDPILKIQYYEVKEV